MFGDYKVIFKDTPCSKPML